MVGGREAVAFSNTHLFNKKYEEGDADDEQHDEKLRKGKTFMFVHVSHLYDKTYKSGDVPLHFDKKYKYGDAAKRYPLVVAPLLLVPQISYPVRPEAKKDLTF
jgi:hypothetical protein